AEIQKTRAMKPGTDLERGFITALNIYYNTPDGPATGEVGQSCHGPVGPRDRVIAYEKAMRTLYERYPDDVETQTFYALAVLAVGYANPTDATLSNQLEAAGILEKVWKKNPHHPGVGHYLIHSYDYPSLAERGLVAARSYGPSRHGFLMLFTFHRSSSRGLVCGRNRSRRIALPRTRRALTLRRGIATPPKQKNCMRSITWLTPICRKGRTLRRRRSWISPRPCAKPTPSWNSARLMLWQRSRRVMRSSAMPGPRSE